FQDLARSLRAQLEWAADCGTLGIPSVPLVESEPAIPRPVSSPLRAEPSAESRVQVASPSAESRAQVASPSVEGRAPVSSPTTAAPVRLEPPLPRAPIAVPADAEGRRARLTVLADEVRGCTRCVLHAERTQTVFARGTGSAGLCFVGEGPGADEDAQGYPFVGAAGQLLDRMIVAMGLTRDEVYVCNIVKCRPPKNRKPEPDEMAACKPYLEEQLELVQPQVLVALGATAVQGLLGTTEGITRLRGKWKLYRGRIPVMPTFHPAYLLRTPGAKREVWEDLQAVLRQMGRVLPERRR
ncbi:MAG TPA: uracil-DNA glycosylase family protein, partial [Polyangiaceae bacterium]|nr:uracil-DNA glycosylase family protein [Polyangiaceae bacterium]